MPFKETVPNAPVHFRVLRFGPSPLPTGEEFVLHVEYVNRPGGIRFGLSRGAVAPYLDAINEASRTHATYWVGWDQSRTPVRPGHADTSTSGRLLDALRNHQVVPEHSGPVD